jgi:heterodisulfide reductase subunit A
MTKEATPRVGVFICKCGGKISGSLDTERLRDYAQSLPEVAYASSENYPCSKDGLLRIQNTIHDHQLDRVLIAGCAPRLVEKLFKEAAIQAELDPGYLHVVNIRETSALIHQPGDPAGLTQAAGIINMSTVRLSASQTAPTHKGPVARSAVVIGSGLSALTVALALADSKNRVALIEKGENLGETTADQQERTRQLTAERVQVVRAHPMIDIFLEAQVSEVSGHPGGYEIHIEQGKKSVIYTAGAIIVSNTPVPKALGKEQWFDRQRVKTQSEFEQELQASHGNGLPLNDIVMVFCAEQSQRERCSRVCCQIGIQQAMRAKQLNPNARITVLFRDLYLGGIGSDYEGEFMEARRQGITFFRYRNDHPPVIGDRTIDVLDSLTGVPLQLSYDRIVLTMPLVPQSDSSALAAKLALPQDDDGFMAEPRLRLRPGRYADPGIYVLGSGQQPADTSEALFQAYLTGARAIRFLKQETIKTDAAVAAIDPAVCTGCGNCTQVCPTSAIHLEKRDGVLSLSEVDDLRCIGCGNCVVVCPVKAISMPGWDNIEIPVQISAAFEQGLGDISFRKGAQTAQPPKVLALACEWSAYASAELAGTRKLSYPASVRILRMNCSARFDPYHILWAFLTGADGVFLGACPPGECHYGTGNLFARERVEVLKKELAQHGIDPRRLRLEFLSVDDGVKFAQTLTEFVEEISKEVLDKKSVGPPG